jgi:hypothetical protein
VFLFLKKWIRLVFITCGYIFLDFPEVKIIITAPIEDLSKRRLQKLANMIQAKLPSSSSIIQYNSKNFKVRDENGKIKSLSVFHGVNNIRGITTNLMVVEESAFLDNDVLKKVLEPLQVLENYHVLLEKS